MTTNFRSRHQIIEKYLHFHEDLLSIQVKNMQHLVAVIPFKKLSRIDVETSLKEGKQLISPANILIDEKEIEYIFDQIFPVLKKNYSQDDNLIKFEDFYDKRKLSLKSLVDNVLSKNDNEWENQSQNFDISKKFLIQISEYLTAPYLELCSEFLNKKIKDTLWNKSYCPICGYHPAMALTNDTLHHRIFWCRLCGTEWKFDDILCPFCLNDNLKTLKHIFPPEKSPYRIDACDKCEKYIKIVDNDFILGAPNFEIEYFATYRLDLLAVLKGYLDFNENYSITSLMMKEYVDENSPGDSI